MISIFKHARYRNLGAYSLQPFVCGCSIQKCNASTQTKIEIPKRIEREPTDILQALASTVKRDPTANHYQFPDDPHIEINTQVQKRVAALSLEAGRKAAWWVVQKNQKLFNHKEANPPIKAFFPPEKRRMIKGTEKALLIAIEETRVLDAIHIYKLIEKNKRELKDESKQKLLELCCFYNSLDHDDERLILSKWFKKVEEEDSYKTWQSEGFAENLFVEMENDPKAVCAMIQGRIKYNDIVGGYKLYEKAVLEDIPLTTEVYNCLLGVSGFFKQSDEDRWKLLLDILREMNSRKIPVNIGTLNSALKAVSTYGRSIKIENSLLPLLAEFRRLGITPSLGTYYYILKSFQTKSKKSLIGVINTVLEEIRGKKFEIQHESDVLFFPFAMRECENLHKPDLGRLLHEELLNGQNYNFIADDLSESKYYKNFLCLVFNDEPIERAVELFTTLVPKIYSPDFQTIEKAIVTISENGAIEHFPVIWDILVLMDIRNIKIFENMSKALVANPPVANEFKEFYAKVATHIMQEVEEAKEQERSSLRWSSELINNLFTLYTRAGELEKALKVFREGQKDSTVEIRYLPLSEFLELCISQQKISLALECLQYGYERGSLNVIEMAKRIKSECILDDQQAAFVQRAMDA